MKRGGPIRRKKPLRAGPPPDRHTSDGWRKGVFKATVTEWLELRRLKLGPCRVCGATRVTLHHLVGGNLRHDHEHNLVPLCGDGTTGCHGIITSHNRGVSGDGATRTWGQVADAIRRTLTAPEFAYVVALVGEDGLDRRYPLLRAA